MIGKKNIPADAARALAVGKRLEGLINGMKKEDKAVWLPIMREEAKTLKMLYKMDTDTYRLLNRKAHSARPVPRLYLRRQAAINLRNILWQALTGGKQ